MTLTLFSSLFTSCSDGVVGTKRQLSSFFLGSFCTFFCVKTSFKRSLSSAKLGPRWAYGPVGYRSRASHLQKEKKKEKKNPLHFRTEHFLFFSSYKCILVPGSSVILQNSIYQKGAQREKIIKTNQRKYSPQSFVSLSSNLITLFGLGLLVIRLAPYRWRSSTQSSSPRVINRLNSPRDVVVCCCCFPRSQRAGPGLQH